MYICYNYRMSVEAEKPAREPVRKRESVLTLAGLKDLLLKMARNRQKKAKPLVWNWRTTRKDNGKLHEANNYRLTRVDLEKILQTVKSADDMLGTNYFSEVELLVHAEQITECLNEVMAIITALVGFALPAFVEKLLNLEQAPSFAPYFMVLYFFFYYYLVAKLAFSPEELIIVFTGEILEKYQAVVQSLAKQNIIVQPEPIAVSSVAENVRRDPFHLELYYGYLLLVGLSLSNLLVGNHLVAGVQLAVGALVSTINQLRKGKSSLASDERENALQQTQLAINSIVDTNFLASVIPTVLINFQLPGIASSVLIGMRAVSALAKKEDLRRQLMAGKLKYQVPEFRDRLQLVDEGLQRSKEITAEGGIFINLLPPLEALLTRLVDDELLQSDETDRARELLATNNSGDRVQRLIEAGSLLAKDEILGKKIEELIFGQICLMLGAIPGCLVTTRATYQGASLSLILDWKSIDGLIISVDSGQTKIVNLNKRTIFSSFASNSLFDPVTLSFVNSRELTNIELLLALQLSHFEERKIEIDLDNFPPEGNGWLCPNGIRLFSGRLTISKATGREIEWFEERTLFQQRTIFLLVALEAVFSFIKTLLQNLLLVDSRSAREIMYQTLTIITQIASIVSNIMAVNGLIALNSSIADMALINTIANGVGFVLSVLESLVEHAVSDDLKRAGESLLKEIEHRLIRINAGEFLPIVELDSILQAKVKHMLSLYRLYSSGSLFSSLLISMESMPSELQAEIEKQLLLATVRFEGIKSISFNPLP